MWGIYHNSPIMSSLALIIQQPYEIVDEPLAIFDTINTENEWMKNSRGFVILNKSPTHMRYTNRAINSERRCNLFIVTCECWFTNLVAQFSHTNQIAYTSIKLKSEASFTYHCYLWSESKEHFSSQIPFVRPLDDRSVDVWQWKQTLTIFRTIKANLYASFTFTIWPVVAT